MPIRKAVNEHLNTVKSIVIKPPPKRKVFVTNRSVNFSRRNHR